MAKGSVQVSERTLVKFSKDGCTPCVMVDNYLKEKGIEVECIHNPSAHDIEVCGLSSVPTLILFVDGAEADRVVGFDPEAIGRLVSK
jgi:glutaredoxin